MSDEEVWAPDDWHSAALLQATLDGIPDPVFVKDRAHRWIALNAAFCALLGLPRERLLGRSDPDLFPPDQVDVFWRVDDLVIRSATQVDNEEQITDGSGRVRTIWTRKIPLRDIGGAVFGLCGIITDVTDLRERLRRVERMEAAAAEEQARIAALAATLDALTVPIVEIWEGVLLISLIGELSARRVDRALNDLLAALARARARWVLIDLTGVPGVDAAVAEALLRATRAAALIGCESVVCGVGPAIARTLAELHLDLGGARTCGTVRAGLALALARR